MTKGSVDRGRHRSASNSGIASTKPAGTEPKDTASAPVSTTPATTPTPDDGPSPAPVEAGAAPSPAARFYVVWQFEVAEQNVAAFEAAYGSDGDWARLFRTSPDYRGTELLRDAYVAGLYLTIDRWESEEAFRAFRRAHDADYEKLDRQCDSLTAKETRIGAYKL